MSRWLGFVVAAAACSKAPAGKPAEIIDLTDSMDDLKLAFDAKRGENRFVALLSPT